MLPISLPVRLSLFFIAIFLVVGLYMPYWPIWLAHQGLDERQIAFLAALGLTMRVLSGPAVGSFVDGLGERRRPMIVLCVCAFAAYLAFEAVSGFWALALVTLLTTLFFGPLVPMIETLTVKASRGGLLDYGRVRISGSLSFMAASLLGGFMLDRLGAPSILIGILIALVFMIVAAIGLPDDRAERVPVEQKRPGFRSSAIVAVSCSPVFWVFVLGGAFIQGSHAFYYALGSLHWRNLGFDGQVIGGLWTAGVLAEILLFLAAGRLLKRISPLIFIMVGGVAAILRWSVMAFDPPLALLVVSQCLHAFTFGATHLGAIHLIDQAVPNAYSVTAQSMYGAVATGVSVGVLTLGAGDLYAAFGGASYAVMAVAALLGTGALVVLSRIWPGGSMVPPPGGAGSD